MSKLNAEPVVDFNSLFNVQLNKLVRNGVVGQMLIHDREFAIHHLSSTDRKQKLLQALPRINTKVESIHSRARYGNVQARLISNSAAAPAPTIMPFSADSASSLGSMQITSAELKIELTRLRKARIVKAQGFWMSPSEISPPAPSPVGPHLWYLGQKSFPRSALPHIFVPAQLVAQSPTDMKNKWELSPPDRSPLESLSASSSEHGKTRKLVPQPKQFANETLGFWTPKAASSPADSPNAPHLWYPRRNPRPRVPAISPIVTPVGAFTQTDGKWTANTQLMQTLDGKWQYEVVRRWW